MTTYGKGSTVSLPTFKVSHPAGKTVIAHGVTSAVLELRGEVDPFAIGVPVELGHKLMAMEPGDHLKLPLAFEPLNVTVERTR